MNKIWLPAFLIASFLNVQGQNNYQVEEVLRDKLQRYCSSLPWEEIYIHPDRSEYIAGEDMWLTVYLFDRQKYRLSEYNSIAYLELLNANNNQVIKKKINLEKGIGPAHLLLPDTLSTGRYTMRAYTNWMKNFLPENCFTLEVNIYNVINDHSGKGMQWNSVMASSLVNESVQGINNGAVKMTVNNLKPDKLNILIDADESYLKAKKDNFVFLIQTHGEIILTKYITLESQPLKLSIPKEVLLPGINQIVIFNDALEPVCERLIYTPLKESQEISVSCADSFKTREKVKIEFNFMNKESTTWDRSSLSISVTPAEGGIFIPDIDEYMVFGTEFGMLPGSFRNKHLRDIRPEIVDSFLVNAKSRWINWNKVISGKLPVMKHERETDTHFLTGRLVNKNTNAAEPGKYMFLSKPGKTAAFQYSRTDSAGKFRFSLPVTDTVTDLVIQPEEGDLNSSIMISPPFSEDFAQKKVKYDTINTIQKDHIDHMGINYQINKIYGISSAGESLKIAVPLPEQKRFYGKPDIELKMDDYIKLPVMEEVFFELTPGALLRKKKSTYSMTIYDPVSKKPFDKPPVVFVDGVVIRDLGAVAAMDPENVEKIDVVKDLYLVGDYIFFGIVNILTRKGDCRNITLPDYAIRTNYRVIDPVESFISPDYQGETTKKSRIPDFRNTLFWVPSFRPSTIGTAEFWTSDSKTLYEINIQGVNKKGQPLAVKKQIMVN